MNIIEAVKLAQKGKGERMSENKKPPTLQESLGATMAPWGFGPGLRAIFNEDNFACVICDKPVKECKCPKEKE